MTEIEEVEADLELTRARVAASVAAIRGEVDRRRDWREWVRRRPGLFVLGALAVGYLLGRSGSSKEDNSNGRT
jgi:hypothetical protein